MSGYLEQLQEDVQFRIMTESYFDTIAIILQRDGVTINQIQQRVAALNQRGGKTGACIIVLMPIVDVPNANPPGPRFELTQSFIVLEHPTINRGASGTGKHSTDIALALLQLFHLFTLGYGATMTARERAITPNDSFDGLVGLQVDFFSRGGLTPQPFVALPTISADVLISPATITMACATAGAAIWYTTDGSYPSSENPVAMRYSAPFVQNSGAIIRAAAELAGLLQSSVRELTIAQGAGSTPAHVGAEGGESVAAEGGETLTAEG